MAALQHVHVPGYAALILRRTYSDLALPGAIMDRARSWLVGRDGVEWNDRDKTFTFAGSGATLTFGFLDNASDRYRYQGVELQFCGWDELTQFPEVDYRYLFSRLRRLKGAEVPLRMRGAANPGGVGHAWVYARFVAPEASTERVFVPSTLDDNPFIDSSEYESSLAQLDPVTRAQLRHGDWEIAVDGNVFRRAWFDRRYTRLPELREIWTCWDTALKAGEANDETAGVTVGLGDDGCCYVLRCAHGRWETPAVARFLCDQADWYRRTYGDRYRGDYIEDKVSGTTMMQFVRRSRPDLALIPISVGADKVARAQGITPLCEAGQVLMPDAGAFPATAGWAHDLTEQLFMFPTTGVHDDMVDAFVYSLARMVGQIGGRRSVIGRSGGQV